MCGGGGGSPNYAAQERAAKAEADKVRAETEKEKSAADAKSLAERTAQAQQDASAAQKRRLLISQSLDDKAQGLDSQDPATRIDTLQAADDGKTAPEDEDPLKINMKKKQLLSPTA